MDHAKIEAMVAGIAEETRHHRPDDRHMPAQPPEGTDAASSLADDPLVGHRSRKNASMHPFTQHDGGADREGATRGDADDAAALDSQVVQQLLEIPAEAQQARLRRQRGAAIARAVRSDDVDAGRQARPRLEPAAQKTVKIDDRQSATAAVLRAHHAPAVREADAMLGKAFLGDLVPSDHTSPFLNTENQPFHASSDTNLRDDNSGSLPADEPLAAM